MSGIERLVLPNGRAVDSHTVPVAEEAMRESLGAAMVAGATHVVTIRGGARVLAGETVWLGRHALVVLAAYDPYAQPGIALPEAGSFAHVPDAAARRAAAEAALRTRVEAIHEIEAQRGRWLKLLVALPSRTDEVFPHG